MEEITINDVFTFLVFVGSVIGAVKVIKDSLNKSVEKMFKPINEKIDNLELSSDKNFLVHFLSCVEQKNRVDEVELERFYETYNRYHQLGGNSYIDHKVEKLKKEGKL